MPFTKQSNRLDDALIAGHITYDQYLAAGGRTPATTLKGLREGSDALVKAKKIREIRKPYDQLTDQDFIRLTLRREGLHGENDEFIDDFYKNLSPENKAKVDSLADVYRPDFGRGPHTDARFWEIYTPTDASMSVLRGKPRVTTTPLEAEYEAELIRRHEIDEKLMQTRRRRRTIRRRGMDLYEKYKPSRWEREEELRLRSFGHNHPRVIVNEHSNLVRAPEPVRKSFYDARTETKEVPSYKLQSGGDFEYGRGLNNIPLKPEGGYAFGAAKHRLDKALADRFPLDYEKSLKFRLDALEKAEELASKGRGRLLDDVADLAAAVVKHSEYNSNNTPFTKQSNRLDDALIAGHITHDQYLAAGGRTPETMLRGLREGSDALVKRHGIREIRSARDLVSPEPHRRAVLKEMIQSPGMGGAALGSDDWRAMWRLSKTKTFDDASLDDLYSKLDRKGHPFRDLENEVNPRVKHFRRSALENFISLKDVEARNAHSLSGSHIYTPTAKTDTLGTKLRNLVGRERNPFEADFEAELIRRHEIDEARYHGLGQKNKKTLRTFGHAHPRVILNEHGNLARAPKNVRDVFLDVRNSVYEAPAYNIASGGKFEYGKGFNDIPVKPGGGYDFNAAKRAIENSIADAHFGDLKASQNARREAVKKVLSPPSLLEVLRSGIRGVGKQSITNALSRAPDASLLGRLSNFIIKHSEYAPSNKSHLKTAYEMGAQEALRRAGI